MTYKVYSLIIKGYWALWEGLGFWVLGLGFQGLGWWALQVRNLVWRLGNRGRLGCSLKPYKVVD